MDPRPEWSTLPSLLCTWSFFRSPMRVMDCYRGRRTCFPSAVDFNFGNRIVYFITIVDVFRGVAEYRGGRTCFPTAFEYVHVVTSEYLCHFTALVYDVHMHFLLVSFLTPRWRGQVFELFRSPVRFSQLSWKGRDGWLPSFGFLQGLVVLCLLDSSDLKFPLRRACLESSSFLRY